MKKIILLLIGLTVISCGGSDDGNIIESACPCTFTARTTELFPITSVSYPEISGSGPKVIGKFTALTRYPYTRWSYGFYLPYPCQDYIGRSYETDIGIQFNYIQDNGYTGLELIRQEETYSFIMNQEWINAINSSGSIDGFNLTLKDCLESDYESN